MPGSIGHPEFFVFGLSPSPLVGEGWGEGEQEKAFTLTLLLSHQGRGNFERGGVREEEKCLDSRFRKDDKSG